MDWVSMSPDLNPIEELPRRGNSPEVGGILLQDKTLAASDPRLFTVSQVTYQAYLPRDWLQHNKYSSFPFDYFSPCVLEGSRRQGGTMKPAACEIHNSLKKSPVAPMITEEPKKTTFTYHPSSLPKMVLHTLYQTLSAWLMKEFLNTIFRPPGHSCRII